MRILLSVSGTKKDQEGGVERNYFPVHKMEFSNGKIRKNNPVTKTGTVTSNSFFLTKPV